MTSFSSPHPHQDNSVHREMRKHPSFPSHVLLLPVQEILSLWEPLVMAVMPFDVAEMAKTMWGNAGWPLCWTASMLSASLSIMINVSILWKKLLGEEERVTLGMPVPPSGLVVRENVAAASALTGMWRTQVDLNKGPHPCQFLAWRKCKQNYSKGSHEISQQAII